MKVIYYDPATLQVMSEYESPNDPGSHPHWTGQGFIRAVVPDALRGRTTRETRVTLDRQGSIVDVVASPNPTQSAISEAAARKANLIRKLGDDTITVAETRELLRLERGM